MLCKSGCQYRGIRPPVHKIRKLDAIADEVCEGRMVVLSDDDDDYDEERMIVLPDDDDDDETMTMSSGDEEIVSRDLDDTTAEKVDLVSVPEDDKLKAVLVRRRLPFVMGMTALLSAVLSGNERSPVSIIAADTHLMHDIVALCDDQESKRKRPVEAHHKGCVAGSKRPAFLLSDVSKFIYSSDHNDIHNVTLIGKMYWIKSTYNASLACENTKIVLPYATRLVHLVRMSQRDRGNTKYDLFVVVDNYGTDHSHRGMVVSVTVSDAVKLLGDRPLKTEVRCISAGSCTAKDNGGPMTVSLGSCTKLIFGNSAAHEICICKSLISPSGMIEMPDWHSP
jgi:hypothetical protein